jgi:hypothetical protein
MANKIKETEWVVPKKKDILDLIALQEGVPIEHLLAHVAPKPPDAAAQPHSHTTTQPNPTQCPTNATQTKFKWPFGSPKMSAKPSRKI